MGKHNEISYLQLASNVLIKIKKRTNAKYLRVV